MKRLGGVAGRGGKQKVGWWCVEAAAGLLAPLECEVVLGDLAETDRGAWRGLGDVLGLTVRRQLALWRSWRPWAASFGLALPASLFLMGWSVAASGAVGNFLGEPAQVRLLWFSLSKLFLMISWAWVAGFAVGAVARSTLWASVLACCVPCLHCLSMWPSHGLSFLRLLIFVVPGLWGVWCGRRDLQLGFGSALLLAVIAGLAPFLGGKAGWLYGCCLLWPACYLAATARRAQA